MAQDQAKQGPILPVPGERNILITSALPYVNNTPHLGNIIGSVLSADVFARYCRGRGINTLYICGTDNYGTTSEMKALQEGVSVQDLCDKYNKIHKEVYRWFNIEFDYFGQTPTKQQTEITQQIFTALNSNGYLKEEATQQLFCEQHHSFLADRFVEGICPLCAFDQARGDQCDFCGQLLDSLDLKSPRCKLDGATPIVRDTKHIFLELDKLQPQIDSFYRKSAAEGGWPNISKDITSAWLKEGLRSRSITRDMKWGTPIPLPGYEDKVIYPWFDACIGYVSITACYTDQWQEGLWEQWWRNPKDVKLYQFMGKDNVVFHAVIFPGSQLGTKDPWVQVNHLSAADYLTYEGGKFSKSRGIGVFGDSAQKTGVSSDIWRYYLLAQRPETGDSEFNWESFISANNNILLKNLGNFVSRVVKFLNSKHYNSIVPDYTEYVGDSFDGWKEKVNQLLTHYIEELDAVKLRDPLSTVFSISAEGNLFLQSNGLDNKLAETEPLKCAAVIGFATNLIHLLASAIAPYMPETAKSMNSQLRASPLQIPDQWTADTIKPGHEVGKAAYLFSNIKAEKAEEWRKSFGGDEAQKAKEEQSAKKAKKKAAKAAKVAKSEKPELPADGGANVAPNTELPLRQA